MKYYPINLDIRGKRCVVVGGGEVAERKVRGIFEAGGVVWVISPSLTAKLSKLWREGSICYIPRSWEPGDLEGAFLVFAASDQAELNAQVISEARRRGILSNSVDNPLESDFTLPSTLKRGDLLIGISTSGKSPAFSKKLREDLEEMFGEEHALFLDLMGKIRQNLVKEGKNPSKNRFLFHRLVYSDLLELIKKGQRREIDLLLQDILGEGFSLCQLGIDL